MSPPVPAQPRVPSSHGWLSAVPDMAPAVVRTAWPDGIHVEQVCCTPGAPTAFAFEGERLMLRLGESGSRRDGETFLSDGRRSTARRLGGRFHLAVPGTRLEGWSVPAGTWSYAVVYLDAGLVAAEPDLARRFAAIRPGLAFEDPGLAQTTRKLVALAAAGGADDLHAAILARLLVVELAQRDGAAPPRKRRGGLSPAAMRRATALMLDRLAEGATLSEVAAAAGLTPWHFCRAFRDTTGVPPHRWLTAQRMERAREWLAGSDRAVIEVALAVGYGGASQFAAAFRRHTGLGPAAYRSAVRSARG